MKNKRKLTTKMKQNIETMSIKKVLNILKPYIADDDNKFIPVKILFKKVTLFEEKIKLKQTWLIFTWCYGFGCSTNMD